MTRFSVSGNAFDKENRITWLFDFSIAMDADDDSNAQDKTFAVFSGFDIDITEIEEDNDDG